MNGHKEMAAIILQNMSDKNISDPSKGPLLDPILRKIISNWFNHKESGKINNIQLLSDLLEIFTVNNRNLNNKGYLFGSTTLPLLEKLYNPCLSLLNENIKRLSFKLFSQRILLSNLLSKETTKIFYKHLHIWNIGIWFYCIYFG